MMSNLIFFIVFIVFIVGCVNIVEHISDLKFKTLNVVLPALLLLILYFIIKDWNIQSMGLKQWFLMLNFEVVLQVLIQYNIQMSK